MFSSSDFEKIHVGFDPPVSHNLRGRFDERSPRKIERYQSDTLRISPCINTQEHFAREQYPVSQPEGRWYLFWFSISLNRRAFADVIFVQR